MFPSRYFSPLATSGVSGPYPWRTSAATVRAVIPGPPPFGKRLPSSFCLVARNFTAGSTTDLMSAGLGAAAERFGKTDSRAGDTAAAEAVRSQSRRVNVVMCDSPSWGEDNRTDAGKPCAPREQTGTGRLTRTGRTGQWVPIVHR